MRNYTIQKIAAASLTAVTGCIPLEQERNYVENASTIKGLVENVNSITGDPDDNFALMQHVFFFSFFLEILEHAVPLQYQTMNRT